MAETTGRIPIFSLAFGTGADWKLVQKMAIQNDGVARKIYSDSDAALQISGFFDEIAVTLLNNVSVKYLEDSVDDESLTKSEFKNYFKGSELVVAGKLTDAEAATVDLEIFSNTVDGALELTVDKNSNFIHEPDAENLMELTDFQKITEKTWAYLTIKQLLSRAEGGYNKTVVSAMYRKAKKLSLKYGFVTPLTSMVEKQEVEQDEWRPPTAPKPPAPTAVYYRQYGGDGGGGGGGYGGGGGGDPHYMIRIKNIEHPICFDVQSKAGEIHNIITDPRNNLNEDEMKNITDAKESKNTKQATKHAVKIFRTYLSEKGVNADFENFCKTELTARLRTFYAELRNKDGDMYKRTSLQSVRSGLRRFISQTNDIDIVSDPEFNSANEMFTCVCKEAYKNGRGSIDHKRPIEKSDLEKLYESVAFNINAPTGLLNKVWFELCMYFCRRGRENQRELTPDMFDIATDANGKRYVYQTQSEISKNHQGVSTSEIDDKNVRMYETQSTMCPVKSFEKYLSKRNPNCEALFQTPRDSFLDSDSVWFENRPLGKNKLGNKMKDLAHQAQLSYPYTNHCIRATTITALSHAGFEARHIMTVSGHRNEASVKSYCRDTTTTQKQQMSAVISSLTHDSTNNEDENCEDNFNDGLNDILALSLSQTERILMDISNYEAIVSSTGTSSDKGGNVQPVNVQNAMQPVQLDPVNVVPPVNIPNAMQPVQLDQVNVGPHSVPLNASVVPVHSGKAVKFVQSDTVEIRNNLPVQEQTSSFSFHGCAVNIYNYNQ